MRRIIIYFGYAVLTLWAVAVTVRLTLPLGEHLFGLADEWLFILATAATILWTATGTYAVSRHMDRLQQVFCWILFAFSAIGIAVVALILICLWL